MEKEKKSKSLSTSFKIGSISLAFLIIGYQSALFIHRAAVLRIEESRDRPDTVFVYLREPEVETPTKRNPDEADPWRHKSRDRTEKATEARAGNVVVEKTEFREAEHSKRIKEVRDRSRKVESFPFNPNTASMEEFRRLGFSERQAQSILNYRAKGGRFRRASDFGKSFVVADSVFIRLEPWIDIPKVDINKADSAALDALPGIGPYLAKKIISYRQELGGFTSTEQLMDIDYFDREKYDSLSDLICCESGIK